MITEVGMKLIDFTRVFFPAAAVVVEALPFSAVLKFGSPGAEVKTEVYSSFDPLVFGAGNICPMICSVLSVLLLVISVAAVISKKRAPGVIGMILSALTFVESLGPVFTGHVTVWTVVIAVFLVCSAIVSAVSLKRKK